VSSRKPVEFTDWPQVLKVGFGPYRAVCHHHVDGDTFDFLIDKGFNGYDYHAVRLYGVDTPETNRAASKAAGLAAKEFVQRAMPVGARVVLRTLADPDSFGRYLAAIQLEDGRDLATELIRAGHAVPFEG
jgi:endonuclease YncB( thermonuclease family)